MTHRVMAETYSRLLDKKDNLIAAQAAELAELRETNRLLQVRVIQLQEQLAAPNWTSDSSNRTAK